MYMNDHDPFFKNAAMSPSQARVHQLDVMDIMNQLLVQKDPAVQAKLCAEFKTTEIQTALESWLNQLLRKPLEQFNEVVADVITYRFCTYVQQIKGGE